ncbi:WxL domain-containing protein [Listeria weihenstephanensis]|uniref:WxL domain-containing protein n=1 Tax=Listeria weihenstephanensis TaxID=1006155 RepID=A0A841Z7Z0_9LIST|nr:WxL domain-containing protein [Listeria weihenstephanensis]MBC1501308.1 WxL domain-containing protein [Listeria weihenstephanensis]
MKLFTKSLLIGTLAIGTLFGTSTLVHADSATSTGKVILESDDSAVSPLDPTNPDNPVPTTPDPTDSDNSGTGNTGALTIDFLSNVDFGEQKISNSTETYKAKNANPYVQVTDKRGTGAGWTLTATASNFSDGAKVLKGAQMSLNNGQVRTRADNQSAAPVVADVTLNGATQTIFSASEDAGMGTWLDVYAGTDGANENVTLRVPSGNLAGEYTSTITWTLEDSPSAE